MPRLSLIDLRSPPPAFDPALARDSEGRVWFETEADAEGRDRQRGRRLRRFAGNVATCRQTRSTSLLRRKLSTCNPKTLASARNMRNIRRQLAGALWELVSTETASEGLSAFTLIPGGLQVRPEDLDRYRARQLMNRLRAQLNRAGAGTASGWLVAALHCDFDPTAELYQFHYHRVAAGGMIGDIDRLRLQTPYKRAGQ